MPITAGAIRKLRSDKRRDAVNLKIKRALREAVLVMRRKPTEKSLRAVFTAADRAVKKRVIHDNKAARLKSRLAALVNKRKSS